METCYVPLLLGIFVIFLLRIGMIELDDTSDVTKDTKDAREIGSGVMILAVLFDFFTQTTKYIVYALIVSVFSLAYYVWCLAKPTKEKTYVLLIVGLGYAWISLAPPQEAVDFLAGDTHGYLLTTLKVLAHIFIVTAAVQFVIAMTNEDYFSDVAEVRKKLREARVQYVQEQAWKSLSNDSRQILTEGHVRPFFQENPWYSLEKEIQYLDSGIGSVFLDNSSILSDEEIDLRRKEFSKASREYGNLLKQIDGSLGRNWKGPPKEPERDKPFSEFMTDFVKDYGLWLILGIVILWVVQPLSGLFLMVFYFFSPSLSTNPETLLGIAYYVSLFSFFTLVIIMVIIAILKRTLWLK